MRASTALRRGCATERCLYADHACTALLYVETHCSDERRTDMLFINLMEYK
jgi:hypothetical protein